MAQRDSFLKTRWGLEWNGRKLEKVVVRAIRQGVEHTANECVKRSKALTPTKTSTLQGSIQRAPTVVTSGGIRSEWGSFDVEYALYVEAGLKGGTTKPYRTRPFTDKLGRRYQHGRRYPRGRRYKKREGVRMLSRAADEEYPKLADRIRKRLRGKVA